MRVVFLSFLTLLSVAQAFVSQSARHAPRTPSSDLSMARRPTPPKFDKATQKWLITSPEQGPEAGYPVINTLLLHGPKPWFQRIFNKDEY